MTYFDYFQHNNELTLQNAIKLAEGFSKRKARTYVETSKFFIIGTSGFDGVVGIEKKDRRPYVFFVQDVDEDHKKAFKEMKPII